MDREYREILAPDGILIRPISGVGSPLVSVVVGVIPARDAPYPVHFHYALEQVTYVLRGQVTALTRAAGDAAAREVRLGVGDAITTPPTTMLSFRNAGPADAEVLFICVPPYPASNADTELVGDEHRPLSERELARVTRRQRHAQAYLQALLEARLQAAAWLSSDDDA